jgi:hypothetical protein
MSDLASCILASIRNETLGEQLTSKAEAHARDNNWGKKP